MSTNVKKCAELHLFVSFEIMALDRIVLFKDISTPNSMSRDVHYLDMC